MNIILQGFPVMFWTLWLRISTTERISTSLKGFPVMFWTLWLRFSTTESKTLQETPEEFYYRKNLGLVSQVQAMDKAEESLVVIALVRFFSHLLVHLPHQSGQNLPSSCQKQETPNIALLQYNRHKQHVSVHGSFSPLYYRCQ